MSFSDLCFFPDCSPPTPKSKVPSCLRAPNWSLYITLASHSGLFRMSKCHVIPLPETVRLPTDLEINLPHGVLHGVAPPAHLWGRYSCPACILGLVPGSFSEPQGLCSCCSFCWEHTASHLQIRPRPYASEDLPCLPGACTVGDVACICMTMRLASASRTRLSLGDGSTGSAFRLPLCPHYLAYRLV